jgi:hypothetical protein
VACWIGRRTSKRGCQASHRVRGVSRPRFREPLTHQLHDAMERFALPLSRVVQLVRTSAFLRGPEPGHGFEELAHRRRLLARDLVDRPHGRGRLLECLDRLGFVRLAGFAEASGESVARGRELWQREGVEAGISGSVPDAADDWRVRERVGMREARRLSRGIGRTVVRRSLEREPRSDPSPALIAGAGASRS